ncbi:uncharacterized protein LOC125231675 [Leguminivora glycinivorella]|uniref:uncharacterized protein LOC125231675 n=1 Tax=Leguminivora glycinivorella TaxID=1035111 RepID=UPI00200DBE97|nr:uncharacterized protein LOC125231675 [Leguminivora glycinivorella]
MAVELSPYNSHRTSKINIAVTEETVPDNIDGSKVFFNKTNNTIDGKITYMDFIQKITKGLVDCDNGPEIVGESVDDQTINIVFVHKVAKRSVPNDDDGVNYYFKDKTTRIGFIQKVLSIKLLQMLLVTLVLGIFVAAEERIYWAITYNHTQVHNIILSTLLFIATTTLLIYCNKTRHENPYRYLFLTIHPLSFAFFVSFPTIYLKFLCPFAVAWATYIAALFSVLFYSVFALQTDLEFAARHSTALSAITQIIVYAITVPFIHVDGFGALYVALFLSLDYIYIFFDLEIMTTKKYWNDVTPSDFIDAAIYLHLDYYYIFKNVIVPSFKKSTEAPEVESKCTDFEDALN